MRRNQSKRNQAPRQGAGQTTCHDAARWTSHDQTVRSALFELESGSVLKAFSELAPLVPFFNKKRLLSRNCFLAICARRKPGGAQAVATMFSLCLQHGTLPESLGSGAISRAKTMTALLRAPFWALEGKCDFVGGMFGSALADIVDRSDEAASTVLNSFRDWLANDHPFPSISRGAAISAALVMRGSKVWDENPLPHSPLPLPMEIVKSCGFSNSSAPLFAAMSMEGVVLSRGSNGETVAHVCAMASDEIGIMFSISHGLLHVKDSFGRTPAHYLAEGIAEAAACRGGVAPKKLERWGRIASVMMAGGISLGEKDCLGLCFWDIIPQTLRHDIERETLSCHGGNYQNDKTESTLHQSV